MAGRCQSIAPQGGSIPLLELFARPNLRVMEVGIMTVSDTSD